MHKSISKRVIVLYIATNFVFLLTVYIPSTPNVGKVNNGKMENIFKPFANSGLLSKEAVKFAPRKIVIAKNKPKINGRMY